MTAPDQVDRKPPANNINNTAIISRLYSDDPDLTDLDLTGSLVAASPSSSSSSPHHHHRHRQDDNTTSPASKTSKGDTALSTISDALHCSTHLRSLNLSDNDITDVGAALLADALASEKAARGLTHVILDGNCIGTEGVLAIVSALRQSPKTIYISLKRNQAPVDEAAMFQLNTMVQLNDQPGRLRQVILDLIAENTRAKHNTTRTLDLDLSSAYSRWQPPRISVNAYADVARPSSSSSSSSKIQHQQNLTALFQQFLQILCDTIQHNTILLRINLSNNFITDEGARSICRMIQQNRHLDELYLDTNNITDEGANELVKGFADNNTLCVLSLLRNNVSPSMMFQLETAQALNREPLFLKRWFYELQRDSPDCPRSLIFDNKGSQRRYSDVGIRMMCVALEKNTRVRELKIVEADVTDVGCQCIRDLFRHNRNIVKLELQGCVQMGFDGVGRLCDMLSVNDTLEHLGVSRCDIDDLAALRIAAAVEHHPSLTALDVSYNPRIVSSAAAIATVFAHNFRLKTVNVDGTSCTESVKTAVAMRQLASNQPERLRSLFGALISNSWELTSVNLRPSSTSDEKLDDQAIEMLSVALIDNTKVTHLDISGNNVTLAGAKEIYRMLRLNRSTLKTLNVSDNPVDFGIQHAKLVAAVLGLHSVLHSVDISNTGMDDSGVEYIFGEVETFPSRMPVKKIDVSRNKLVSPEAEDRLQLILRAHVLHPVVKRRFRDIHREWKLSTIRSPFRTLKLSHVFDHAADYFDISPPSEVDRVGCVSIALDFVREHAYKTVTVLDVAGNHFGDEGIKLVSEYVSWASLKRNIPIETINAAENSLSDQGIEYLCKAAIDCASIRSISAGGNENALGGSVTEAALAELQARVSFNLQPEEMRNLIKNAEEGTATDGRMSATGDIDEGARSQHHVNDVHISLLVRALKRKGAAEVRSVNFSNNYVSLAGLKDLISLAAQRGCLKRIVLRNTMIRGTEAKEASFLVETLLKTELAHVDLSDNEFKDEFAEVLLPTLRKSKTLVFFSMNGSGLDPSIELAVASSVSLNALSSDIAASGLAGKLRQQKSSTAHQLLPSLSSAISSPSVRRFSSVVNRTSNNNNNSNNNNSSSVRRQSSTVNVNFNIDSNDNTWSVLRPSNVGASSSSRKLSSPSRNPSPRHQQQPRPRRSGGDGDSRNNTNQNVTCASSASSSYFSMTNNNDTNNAVAAIASQEVLNLSNSALDERQLAEIVRMCRASDVTIEIDLSCNKLVDESLSQIVLILIGATNLEKLNLAGNIVGNHTMQTLIQLVSTKSPYSGEGTNLKHLDLSDSLSPRVSPEVVSEFLKAVYDKSDTLWDVVLLSSSPPASPFASSFVDTTDANNNTNKKSSDNLPPDEVYNLTKEQQEELLKIRLNRQLQLKRLLPRIRKNDPSLAEIRIGQMANDTSSCSSRNDDESERNDRVRTAEAGAVSFDRTRGEESQQRQRRQMSYTKKRQLGGEEKNNDDRGGNDDDDDDDDDIAMDSELIVYNEENNIIDDIGMKILSEALMLNSHVWKVELHISHVTEVGIRHLEPVLATGSTISHLSLSGSKLLKEGRAFSDLVKVSKGITTFNIGENRFLTPQSLREVAASIGLRRQIRRCDVSGCGAETLSELKQALEQAKRNYMTNHMQFAVDNGDVDLFRTDDEIKKLEHELKTAAVNLRKYELDLGDAVDRVGKALFFNGHALLLASFVDQESQEQVLMAKQARQARRQAIIDRQKRAAKRLRAKSARLLGDAVDDEDELTEEQLGRRSRSTLYEEIKKQQSLYFSPVQAKIRYDAALDVYDNEDQLEELKKFKQDLEQDEDVKDPEIDEEERYERIQRNKRRARDRELRDRRCKLRQFVYQEDGEPIPGKFFSESPVLTRLDLSRPEDFNGMMRPSNSNHDMILGDCHLRQQQQRLLRNNSNTSTIETSSVLVKMESSFLPTNPSTSNQHLHHRQLEEFFIDDAAVKILCSYLKSNDTVVYLSLANQNLSALSAIHLSQMLTENYSLQDVDLQGNELMDSVGQLCESLHVNHSVVNINCSDNGTSDALLHRLEVLCRSNAEPLKMKDSLLTIFEHRAEPRAIDLSYVDEEIFGTATTTCSRKPQQQEKHELPVVAGGGAAAAVIRRKQKSAGTATTATTMTDEAGSLFKRQTASTSIATAENLLASAELYPSKKLQIDDASASLLCHNGLGRCVSVRFLDISNSNVGDDGVREFIKVLTETRTIVAMHLRNIKITDVAGEAVALAWKTIPTLYEIDLSDNSRISDVTVERAIDAARSTFKCTQFVVDSCEFVSKRAAAKLELLCRVNRTFEASPERVTLVDCVLNEPSRTCAHLDSLYSRNLLASPEALEVICQCIPMSNFVSEVTLEYNNLQDESLPQIIECIKNCPRLVTLSLGGNLFVDVTELCLALCPWMNDDEQEQDERTRRAKGNGQNNVRKNRHHSCSSSAASEKTNKRQHHHHHPHPQRRHHSPNISSDSPTPSCSSTPQQQQQQQQQKRQHHSQLALFENVHPDEDRDEKDAEFVPVRIANRQKQKQSESGVSDIAKHAPPSSSATSSPQPCDSLSRNPNSIRSLQQLRQSTVSFVPSSLTTPTQKNPIDASSSLFCAGDHPEPDNGYCSDNFSYPCPFLRKLYLHRNALSVASAFSIADMLRASDQLEELDVRDNPWGRLGARVIVSSLLVNGGLRSIALEAEGVPESLILQAESALLVNLKDPGNSSNKGRDVLAGVSSSTF